MPTHVSLAADVHDEILIAEEFLDWLTPDRHADLLDGEIAVHAPVSLRHARLLNFVDSLLRIHVERFDLGMVFREVVAVRLSSRNVFLPDLAFYRKDRLGLQRDDYIDGAPDLAVKVLSPRTAHRDVGVKFVEYEQHGVEEYWVLDPETLAHRWACAYCIRTLISSGRRLASSDLIRPTTCSGDCLSTSTSRTILSGSAPGFSYHIDLTIFSATPTSSALFLGGIRTSSTDVPCF